MIENSGDSIPEPWRQQRLSVVVPVLNEEMNLEPFFARLSQKVALHPDFEWEFIFVDDGSTDRSLEKMRELRRQDTRVKALRLSRNFGSHGALTAGLAYASGDAVVCMSADLQDPPSLIKEFIAEWQKGAHVVWGMRRSRGDPWHKKFFASLFYRFCRKIALSNYPDNGIDCSLFDRRVVDTFLTIKEKHGFLFATVLWMGYRQVFVPYDRGPRAGGVSKFSFSQLLKFGLDIIVTFSYFPIRFMSILGIIVSCLSFLYAVEIIVERLFFGLQARGWPSLMVAILFFSGLQLTMMGVLGEYIWRGTDQVKGLPRFIVMEEIGFESKSGAKIRDIP